MSFSLQTISASTDANGRSVCHVRCYDCGKEKIDIIWPPQVPDPLWEGKPTGVVVGEYMFAQIHGDEPCVLADSGGTIWPFRL